ncbi:MAG TPA: 30S ribosomal protein S12 methylthiotransferase RimO [Bacteroidia bacterium]|nr:MAG: ribosomal protein S12 methylthiotransferase RimO [Bacteroidetes bacterium OLB10]MBX3106923.1 30S ribosomal protein S12 methylthiotransferase RimO [Bacteroidota bacterium]MCB8930177.1 30S ribosomal protein S12 methylthiotransferase RimO [Bacteroidia bacterium]MCB0848705.1 30S ribosomal protein S12 methylthiotransferase RimO [Bacteroidota bacterium]MCW5931067.1 30S ribosomal protein S12 methylthiotransferase RimO [Bacteroidota bacterium]
MRTKISKPIKVNVVTLGCSKNVVDSEILMGQLQANDFDVEHESSKNAEIVIVNTCGFIDNAKQESIDTILHYAREKEKGKIEKLIVTGCLSERYKPALEKEIKGVDNFFGTHDLPMLLKTLGADYKHELIGERLMTTPRHFAYMKISEGCDRPCSFCAIPLMRGQHVSKPVEELVKEAKVLAAKGTKELILIAQDSTFYGLDLYKERRLHKLMEQLAAVEGIEWLRLHYAFPSGFPLEILDVMRETPNICKYLDIPLQHASDNMLKSMRRGITREKTTALINTIREKVPGVAVRTTFITGYPGETEKDHETLLRFLEEMRFDRAGVFTYSHEENTHAYTLKDDVDEETKQRRLDELMQVQQQISYSVNQNKVGSTCKVLFDRKEGNYFVGRTEFDSPEVDNEVLVEAQNNYVRIGDFANIKITSAEAFDLMGVRV